MLDKKTYSLLKKLYRVKEMSCSDARQFTGNTDESRSDEQIDALVAYRFVKSVSNEKTNYYGYRITVDGCYYVENSRHQAWQFWFPYLITTFIAIVGASVAVYDCFRAGSVESVCNCCSQCPFCIPQ